VQSKAASAAGADGERACTPTARAVDAAQATLPGASGFGLRDWGQGCNGDCCQGQGQQEHLSHCYLLLGSVEFYGPHSQGVLLHGVSGTESRRGPPETRGAGPASGPVPTSSACWAARQECAEKRASEAGLLHLCRAARVVPPDAFAICEQYEHRYRAEIRRCGSYRIATAPEPTRTHRFNPSSASASGSASLVPERSGGAKQLIGLPLDGGLSDRPPGIRRSAPTLHEARELSGAHRKFYEPWESSTGRYRALRDKGEFGSSRENSTGCRIFYKALQKPKSLRNLLRHASKFYKAIESSVAHRKFCGPPESSAARL
jgi:hypothetical protein